MRQIQHSSGDLAVDRRAAFAEAMARERDFAAAVQVMESVVEAAPHWAAGWVLLGDYRTEAGDSTGALTAYRRVEALDVDGVHGAALRLAAEGGGTVPSGADKPYVEALFDDYAPRFESELVGGLGYGVPPVLGRMVAARIADRVSRAVDLGCGTGLMGSEIRSLCLQLEGIDLSSRMLGMARRKKLYDRLVQAELVEFLRDDAGGIGLLTAADVLNYCGPLPPVLGPAFAALAPRGVFGFSLEIHERSGTLLQRRSLRYVHNADEALRECTDAGFEIAATMRHPIRNERGVPVDGLLVVLRKPQG